MLLLKIRKLLQEHGSLHIADITAQTQADVGTIRPMLELLIKKNKVKKVLPASACCQSGKGCQSGCRFLAFEMYEWTGGR